MRLMATQHSRISLALNPGYPPLLLRHKFVGCAKSRCDSLAACETALRDFAHAIGRGTAVAHPTCAYDTVVPRPAPERRPIRLRIVAAFSVAAVVAPPAQA
jgi:hypothetical protein